MPKKKGLPKRSHAGAARKIAAARLSRKKSGSVGQRHMAASKSGRGY